MAPLPALALALDRLASLRYVLEVAGGESARDFDVLVDQLAHYVP